MIEETEGWQDGAVVLAAKADSSSDLTTSIEKEEKKLLQDVF